MRNFTLGLGCVVVAGLWFVASFAAEHTTDSLETVRRNVAAGKAILVDVREKDEWDEGHVKGATLLPYRALMKGDAPEVLAKQLPKGTILYLYCAAGKRCLRAADILSPQGHDVRALRDGFDDLIKQGFLKAK